MSDNYTLDTAEMDRIIQTMPQRLDMFLGGLAEDIVNDVKLSMNTSPPGREYVRGSVTHVASQPGYPPNIDLGALVNSIHSEKQAARRYWVADGVIYGFHLEEGTATINPRPFIQPAFAKQRDQIAEDVKTFLGLS